MQAARTLLTLDDKEVKRLFEGEALLRRMYKYGLLEEGQNKLDYVLALTPSVRLPSRAKLCWPRVWCKARNLVRGDLLCCNPVSGGDQERVHIRLSNSRQIEGTLSISQAPGSAGGLKIAKALLTPWPSPAQDFLERRLQTLVFKLGLAKSIHHARVLIRQRHIRCATHAHCMWALKCKSGVSKWLQAQAVWVNSPQQAASAPSQV